MARWLGDIRSYFPSTVVQVMQADAIERLNLTRLLLEPEMLDAVEPDVHLVGTLLSLNRVMPDKTQAGRPRRWWRKVVEDLEQRIAQTHPGGGDRRAQPGGAGSTGRATATSTGTARSAPTSSTTSPSTARSSRSG